MVYAYTDRHEESMVALEKATELGHGGIEDLIQAVHAMYEDKQEDADDR